MQVHTLPSKEKYVATRKQVAMIQPGHLHVGFLEDISLKGVQFRTREVTNIYENHTNS